MRLAQFLTDHRIFFEIILHPPAFTAQKRAKFLRVSGKQVVKTVLLSSSTGYFLAVLPASSHVDTAALEKALGRSVRLADSREVAEVFCDCEWGVAAPFGTLYGVSSVIDESLDPSSMLVFEGQTHAEAIRMRCRDFENLERPQRLRFARK